MGQVQSTFNDPTSSLYIHNSSRFTIKQCQVYHNSHIQTTVLNPGEILPLSNDDGSTVPLLNIVPTPSDKGRIQIITYDQPLEHNTPEFIQDNESKGDYFPFLLKLPITRTSTITTGLVLKFTLRVQAPVSNLTFIASTSKANLEDFVTREFHRSRDQIHNNPNVILLGDLNNNTNNPQNPMMEFDFIWRLPADNDLALDDPQFGQPRQGRYTCAFTEYDKREDRLNMISLFSLWVPPSPPPQPVYLNSLLPLVEDDEDDEEDNYEDEEDDYEEEDHDEEEEEESRGFQQENSNIHDQDDLGTLRSTAVTGSQLNYSFPLNHGYHHISGDDPLLSSSSPVFDLQQPINDALLTPLDDNELNITNGLPEVPATTGAASLPSSALTSALKSSPARSIKPTVAHFITNSPTSAPKNNTVITPTSNTTTIVATATTTTTSINTNNNNNSTASGNSSTLVPSRSTVSNSLSITRPSDNDVSQPDDGPLFRAAIATLEKDTGVLKQKIKKLLKCATNLLQQQIHILEARTDFTLALNNLNIKPLGYTFRSYDSRLVRMHRSSIDHLRTYVIEPLKRLYEVDIKSFEIKKREFDDESRDYYSYLARYLTVKTDATAKDKQKADTKHNEKRRSFELCRFDYYSYINDLNGGRKLQHILYCIGLFIEAEVTQFLATSAAYEVEVKPKLDHIIGQIKDAYKDWTRQRTDREVRRRQLERKLLNMDTSPQQKKPSAVMPPYNQHPNKNNGNRYTTTPIQSDAPVLGSSMVANLSESDAMYIPPATATATATASAAPVNNNALPVSIPASSNSLPASSSMKPLSTVINPTNTTTTLTSTSLPVVADNLATPPSTTSTKPTLKVHTGFAFHPVNEFIPINNQDEIVPIGHSEGDVPEASGGNPNSVVATPISKQITKSMIIDENNTSNVNNSGQELSEKTPHISSTGPTGPTVTTPLLTLSEEMVTASSSPSSSSQNPDSDRRKEGLLWSMSRSKVKAKSNDQPINLNKAMGWHKYWVVVAGGKLSEYTNWKQGIEQHNEPINLRVALVRELKQFERRFCFEIITPNLKRVYQATNEEDLVEWIRVINNAIVSTIDGSSSSVKGFRLDSDSSTASSFKSNANINSSTNTDSGGAQAHYKTSGVSRAATSSKNYGHGNAGLNNTGNGSQDESSRSKPITSSSPSSSSSSGTLQKNRSVSSKFAPNPHYHPHEVNNGASNTLDVESSALSPSSSSFPLKTEITGSVIGTGISSADGLLAVVQAHSPSNLTCADCGSKSNVEWVSMNLLCVLCISCSGVHRSLGSHISKIRSLKLDTQAFTPSIADLIANSVNNGSFNMIWEPDTVTSPNQPGLKKRLHDMVIAQPSGFNSPNTPVGASDITQARVSYIQEKYVAKSFVKPVERPNAALRRSIKRFDVNGVLHSLASRANLNTIAALDDGEGLRNKRDMLLGSLIQGSLIVYSLICSTEDGELSSSMNHTIFPIAELLLLNGSKLPLPSDEAFHQLRDSLNPNAQRWIMTKMQREFGDTMITPIPRRDGGSYNVKNTLGLSSDTSPPNHRTASPISSINPGEAIFNSLVNEKKHISASAVGAKFQKRLSGNLTK